MEKDIESLVDKYFSQIEVESADFLPEDDSESDSDFAHITLILPRSLLTEYNHIKRYGEKLPDPSAFWKETNLCYKLREVSEYPHQSPYLSTVLSFLDRDVRGSYQELNDPNKVRLEIHE